MSTNQQFFRFTVSGECGHSYDAVCGSGFRSDNSGHTLILRFRELTVSVNRAPTQNSMYRCAQCVTTHTEQNDHISSRKHAWLKIAHLCVSKIVVIHEPCLVPCRTWHWPQAQVLSHLHHLSFRRSLPHTQVFWRTIHIYPAKIHGRVADQHKSRLSQVMSPKWAQNNWAWQESWDRSVPNTGKIWEKTTQILSPTFMVNKEELYRDVLHPVTDAFRLWLSGEQCRLGSWRWRVTKNAGFTTVHAKSRRLWILSNANCTGETWCIVTGERSKCKTYSSWFKKKRERIMNFLEDPQPQGNLKKFFYSEERSKCTTYSSWSLKKKVWCQVHLKSREHTGNRMQCIHQGVTNRETSSRIPFLNSLARQIWEDLFLKAIKIICSVRQDLNLWSKNIMSDLSIIVSVSFSNKLMLKDWNYRTHNTDILNLDENKFVHKKN